MDSELIGVGAADPDHDAALASARQLRERVETAITYTRARRRWPRTWAVAIRLASIALAAASTVILGFENLGGWIAAAFTLTALVTVLSAIEPFFNHRAIWVLLEEAQAKHHRVLDDLDFYLAASGGRPRPAQIEALHRREQEIWEEMERAWISQRRGGG